MRILRTIGEFGPSIGPSKQAYLLTKGLSKQGIFSIIYTYEVYVNEKIENAKIKKFEPFIKFGHYKISFKMIQEVMRENVDLVHVHGYRNFQTDLGALVSLEKKIPLVITAHGTVKGYEYLNLGLRSRLPNIIYDALTFKLTLRLAKKIIATSKSEANELLSFGIPESKIAIIHNGIEFPNIEVKKDFDDKDTLNILTVSRITYKNNLEMGIKAFAEAYKRNKKLRYIIVGDAKPSRYDAMERGYKEKILKLCKQLGIKDKVIFTGWLSGEALWEAYLKGDIFIWTSRYDNFAHALVEAAYFKLPIISTPVGIAGDLLDKEFLVEHEDYKELSEKILEICENPKLMKEIGEENHKRSLRYSYEKMVREYYKLYSELAS
ncbi:MAG TPA: glycosyltransferase family 4 protein [Geobacterales bacterium]|nr:glycosyltransferase family 4 protein [Geobacterales bacterium]